MFEARTMIRVWRILPTVIIVTLVVCAIVCMIGGPGGAVAPTVAVVVCILFLPRLRGYRTRSPRVCVDSIPEEK